MAFKNEYVPPLEQETSEFLKKARETLRTGYSKYDAWTVDRERDMVLFRRGGGMISTPPMKTTGVLLIARVAIPSPRGSCRSLKSPRKRSRLPDKLAFGRGKVLATQMQKLLPVSRMH